MVRPTGFYRNKAKAIRTTSALLVERHGGQVPRNSDALIDLPGVARKTANVVLGTAFRIPNGFTVDTHAGRVSRRLGLTSHQDPNKVEKDLMDLFSKRSWIDLSHRLVLHGRYICLARLPKCEHCALNPICPSAATKAAGSWKQRAALEKRYVESRGESPTL